MRVRTGMRFRRRICMLSLRGIRSDPDFRQGDIGVRRNDSNSPSDPGDHFGGGPMSLSKDYDPDGSQDLLP